MGYFTWVGLTSYPISLDEKMVDVYKSSIPLIQVNITKELPVETLEVISIITANLETWKYFRIDGKPFEIEKLGEIVRHKAASSIVIP
jgi:hypothetical protein